MKNKKIAVLAVAAVLSMGSLTAVAHDNDGHGAGYERLGHNQVTAYQLFCEYDNTWTTNTASGQSYPKITELGGHLINKADYDAFTASRFFVKPIK